MSFFPSKVYRCPCLSGVIDFCYENDLKSIIEIHDEISSFSINENLGIVFAVKCGTDLNDCIFACHEHVSMVIFGMKKFKCTDLPSSENITIFYNEDKTDKETYCKGCIKIFLRKSICYFYFKEF